MHLANDNDPQSQLYVLMDSEAEGISLEDIPSAHDGDGAYGSHEDENIDNNNSITQKKVIDIK